MRDMSSTECIDVVIIGGGISGIGVAVEALRRGLSVALIEKGRLVSATSNNSLRIIHGGLRYLQNFDFPRVLKSINEQALLLKLFPEELKLLPCIMPLEASLKRSKNALALASITYETLRRLSRRNSSGSQIISCDDAERFVPTLKGHAKLGAFLWHDVVISQLEAFHEKLSSHLDWLGVLKFENCTATQFSQTKEHVTVGLNSTVNGVSQINGRYLVDTTGPWVGSWWPESYRSFLPKFELIKACNFALPKLVEPKFGIALRAAGDNRQLFFVPRDSQTMVGTFYAHHNGTKDELALTAVEKESHFEQISKALPELNLSIDDISPVDIGLLPGIKSKGGVKLIGSERIYRKGRILAVISTKYTTFRSQGERVVKSIFKMMNRALPKGKSLGEIFC